MDGRWHAVGSSVGPSATAADASARGTGQYLYTDIASLVLGPGTYVVGALYETGDSDPVVFDASGIFSNDSAAAYSELRFVNSGTFGFPNSSGSTDDRYFGPTLRIAEVGEPATALLTLAGLVGWARRRRG